MVVQAGSSPNITDERRTRLVQCIEHIDFVIESGYTDDSRTCIRIKLQQCQFEPWMVDSLKKEYEQAGWVVEFLGNKYDPTLYLATKERHKIITEHCNRRDKEEKIAIFIGTLFVVGVLIFGIVAFFSAVV